MRYFELSFKDCVVFTDITEYDLRNTFAHMKAGVATEDEMSD